MAKKAAKQPLFEGSCASRQLQLKSIISPCNLEPTQTITYQIKFCNNELEVTPQRAVTSQILLRRFKVKLQLV